MKKLLTYEEFLKENYLPYFGVKQALDDSVENDSTKISDFHRVYSMSPTWWNTWNAENKDKYKVDQDAFSKTYTASKDGKVIFIYDYSRNKIFTNEKPIIFQIKIDVSPEELDKSKNIDVEDPKGIVKKKKEEKEKKEEEEKDGGDDELKI